MIKLKLLFNFYKTVAVPLFLISILLLSQSNGIPIKVFFKAIVLKTVFLLFVRGYHWLDFRKKQNYYFYMNSGYSIFSLYLYVVLLDTILFSLLIPIAL